MIFGFIGSGNMGGAIIGGIINSDIASPENVIVSDKNEQALKNINEKYGVKVTSDNKETADKADVLFLCVKPQFLYGVIDEIKNSVSDNTVIVSIVAGQAIETIEKAFEHNIKLVRVMPNTPALVDFFLCKISYAWNFAVHIVSVSCTVARNTASRLCPACCPR